MLDGHIQVIFGSSCNIHFLKYNFYIAKLNKKVSSSFSL